MSLLDDVSIVVTPNGYKAGTLFGAIPVPTEGSNVVVNGDFTTDSDWIKGSGWSVASGKATGSSATSNLQQLGILQSGKTYKLTFTISNFVSGSLRPNIGTVNGTLQSSNGTFTEYITSLGSHFYFDGVSAFTGSIDNVSIKEWVGADMDVTRATAATRVDEDGLVNYAEVLGSELVTNGDFELNSDWNNFGTPTTSEQSTEQSHTGTYSWKVIADATLEGIYSPNNFSLTSGLQYTVSLWVYSVSGTSIKSGLNNTNVSVFTVRTVTAGQWTNITYEATATSTGASYISILSENSLNFYVDDVTVKEVTRDNVPRIDYTGGGCPHILSEPQRTNLIEYSEDFTQSWWFANTADVVLSTNLSPDGTQNAYKVTYGTSGNRLGGANFSLPNTPHTNSIYMRKISGSGVVDFKDQLGGSNTVTLTEDWQRYTITATLTDGTARLYVDLQTLNDVIEVYGAQLEEGSYATSYIPNFGTSAGVTRNQDIFTRDGIGSLINSTEGVLFAEIAALSDDSVSRKISLNSGTFANQITVSYGSGGSNIIQCIIYDGTNVVVNMSYSSTNITDFNKIAIKYISGNTSLWVNGVEVDTDNAAFSGLSLSALSFDNGSSTNFFYGKVKQLQVYNTALTDEQLTSLTT